jgi:hypothetical protein
LFVHNNKNYGNAKTRSRLGLFAKIQRRKQYLKKTGIGEA